MTFLQENQDKIDWFWLSQNPAAIDMLKANPDKIIWQYLSSDPAAIDLLKENPDKINWSNLSRCYWCRYRHKAILRCGLKRNWCDENWV
jgi:hypothetical protein